MNKIIKIFLEETYKNYHRREYVDPDPLQFLYRFDDIRDREIAALTASCLAYGRVQQIIKSVALIIDFMKPSPYLFVKNISQGRAEAFFSAFQHRFTTGAQFLLFLNAVSKAVEAYGSLNKCFLSGMSSEDKTSVNGLIAFVDKIQGYAPYLGSHLIPSARKGSACKRLNLFLRWMVRRDGVDPGGWKGVKPAQLIIPLDTHIFKIGRAFGFTRRKQPDLKAAIEITNGFSLYCPEDPLRYDFSLTRFGIRQELDMKEFLIKVKGLSGSKKAPK